MDPLQDLEEWAAPLLANLSPPAQRGLVRKVAQQLRKSQAARIAKQQNPDGTAFVARKATTEPRPTKARAMFGKIRQAAHLKVLADPAGAAVGFTGRAARIARIHQEGLRAEVTPGGPMATYPMRQLLGFTAADIELVKDTIVNALAK